MIDNMSKFLMNQQTINQKYVIVDVKNQQYMLEEGQRFVCDRLNVEVGAIVDAQIIASSGNIYPAGTAKLKVLGHKLGPKKVIFHKTPRNTDRHFGGKGGARRSLTELQLESLEGVKL